MVHAPRALSRLLLVVLGFLLVAGCAGTGPLTPVGPLSDLCDLPSCCPAGLAVQEGTDGADRLRGGAAADCQLGKAGDDSLRGWCGADLLVCGTGDDRCSGGGGADRIVGGAGADRLRGRCGRDWVDGGAGADEIVGGFGSDDLRGGRGDDRLTGGPGADLLRPGPGADLAFGRGGSDVFVIGAACEATTGDVIDGGRGFDRVQSPLSRAELEARGVSFVSVESFETIAPRYDECIQVAKPWGQTPVAAPGGGIFVEAVARADGGALAATGGGVFAVSPDGVVASLGAADRAVLDPSGEKFGLIQGGTLTVREAGGAVVGGFGGMHPLGLVKLAPGSAVVYAPEVEVVEEIGVVRSVRLRRPDGTEVSQFPADRLAISRLLPDRLVYTLPSGLVARSFDGAVLWSSGIGVHKLETDGDRSIVVPRWVEGRVVHLTGAAETASSPVDGVVWNLAMAPGGVFSAATTQTELYVFRDGEPTARVPLPVAYASSLDVSDRGEVLVGGQGRQGEGLVLLYHWQGNLLWQEPAGTDRAGWRPAVRFAPSGDRFLVVERRGLTAYDILRSSTP